MRITQGTFSFLPDLTDEQIDAQIQYASATAGRCRSSTPTTRTRATPTGRCGGCRCSTCNRATAPRRAARGARLPRGASRALHQADRLRRDATAGRRPRSLHRQPADGRARLPARPDQRRATVCRSATRSHSIRRRRVRPAARDRTRRGAVAGCSSEQPASASTTEAGADAGRACGRRRRRGARPARPRAGRARARSRPGSARSPRCC